MRISKVLMPGFVIAGLSVCAAAAEDQGVSNHAAGRSEAARRLFSQHCAKCHGEDFTGREFRQTDRRIPDFTDGAWQRSRTDAQLLVSIRDGKGEDMPPFNDRIKDTQRRELVAMIRAAGPTKPAPADPEAEEFERRYRELREEMAALLRQSRELANMPSEGKPSDK